MLQTSICDSNMAAFANGLSILSLLNQNVKSRLIYSQPNIKKQEKISSTTSIKILKIK